MQIAAAAATTAATRCLEATDTPGRVVEACSMALGSGQLSARDSARLRLARAQAYGGLRDTANATIDRHAAIKLLDGQIDLAQPDAALLFLRASAWHAESNAGRALADYDAAIRAYPFSPLMFIDRGILLTTFQHSYLLAVMDFDRALELAPGNAAALYGRALAHRARGEEEQAIADQSAALARDPSIAERFASTR